MLKVYMTEFFLFPRLNLPNVLIIIANFFSIAIFLPPVLMYQKRQIHFRWGTKPRDQGQETGNDCDVISELQATRKTDFSDIFLFSYKQRTMVLFLSKLISSQ